MRAQVPRLVTEGRTRLRIVHMIPHDGVGGVEVAARSMLARTHPSCEFTLLLLAGEACTEERRNVMESPFRSPLNPLAQLRAALLCVRSKVDVLICSLWRSVPAALLVRLLRPRTKLAFFVNAEKAVHIADALFCRIGMALADEVWVDSYATLRTRLPKLQKRTRIISFGTAPQPPPSATAKLRPRFVSWSRLNRQKGIDRALHFIAGLSEAGVEPNYEIWGPDGGELQHLKTLTDQLGIGRHVSFCGTAQQESLARIAAEASFFLQLSRFEGMAMAVVEAMQFGLVPIVTAVGEIPRYVADGISGIIVDADDPQVGVQRTVRLLGDEADFQRLRQGALAFWRDAPLYADDVYRAAADLAGRGQTIDPASASG